MALIKPFKTDHGITCDEAYHKLAYARFVSPSEVMVQLRVYADRQAREKEMEPFVCSYHIKNFPVAIAGESLIQWLYRAVKTLPEYQDGKDA